MKTTTTTLTSLLQRVWRGAAVGAALLLWASGATANDGFSVDRELHYCHRQVVRALAQLRKADGSYDFALEPRNILATDKQRGWNCRKATPEEWCSGFWPGILWMDYAATGDSLVRRATAATRCWPTWPWRTPRPQCATTFAPTP